MTLQRAVLALLLADGLQTASALRIGDDTSSLRVDDDLLPQTETRWCYNHVWSNGKKASVPYNEEEQMMIEEEIKTMETGQCRCRCIDHFETTFDGLAYLNYDTMECDCEKWCIDHFERGEDQVGNKQTVTEEEDRLAALIYSKVLKDEEVQDSLFKFYEKLAEFKVDGLPDGHKEQVEKSVPALKKILKKLKDMPPKEKGAVLMTLGIFTPPAIASLQNGGFARTLLDAEYWETWASKNSSKSEDDQTKFKTAIGLVAGIKSQPRGLFAFDESKSAARKGRGDKVENKALNTAFKLEMKARDATCEMMVKAQMGISTCSLPKEHLMITHVYPTSHDAWKKLLGEDDETVCKLMTRFALKNHAIGYRVSGNIASEFYTCGVPYIGGVSGSILEQLAWIVVFASELMTPKVLLALIASLDIIGAHSLSEMVPVARQFFACIDTPKKCLIAAKGEDEVKAYKAVHDKKLVEKFDSFTDLYQPIRLRTGAQAWENLKNLAGQSGRQANGHENFCDLSQAYELTEPDVFDPQHKHMDTFNEHLEKYIEEVFA